MAVPGSIRCCPYIWSISNHEPLLCHSELKAKNLSPNKQALLLNQHILHSAPKIAEVFLIVVKESMAVDVKQVIQELIVPELREIKSEVKGLQSELKRLEEKIDTQGAKFDAKLEALNDKIDLQDIKLDFRSAMKC